MEIDLDNASVWVAFFDSDGKYLDVMSVSETAARKYPATPKSNYIYFFAELSVD